MTQTNRGRFNSETGRAARAKSSGGGPRKGESHRERAIRKLVASLEKLDPEKLTAGERMRLLKLLTDGDRRRRGAEAGPTESEVDAGDDESGHDRERAALRVLGERQAEGDEN